MEINKSGFHKALILSPAMPIASDIILDWIAKDGFSLGESSWVHAATLKRCWQITAKRDGHKYIARAPKREQAAVDLGLLVGYPLDE